ncbi:helix-turn-helix domain-containing protein [Priestia koreensis]|uniref:XRE family transcriptional regulator n=1 Tax=Priestia koreensis TaxID=284581 RepID=A0A0M0LP94_9BACI|nr:helix-turn-helix transcriptional regulator [Priestia koreensis]KOO52717.1 XRE family transcriptional regulator [Priestia koreensis]
MGWNKPRSKFGRWLDEKGKEQEEFVEMSKVSRNTVSKLCNDPTYIPGAKVMKSVMDAVRKMDKRKRINDFFDV